MHLVSIVLIEIDLKLDAWYIYSYLLRKIYWWTRKFSSVSYNRKWILFLSKSFTIFLPLVEGKAHIFSILKSPFDMKFWFRAWPQNFLASALFEVVLWVLVYIQYKEYMKTVYPFSILVVNSNQWNQLSFKCSKSCLNRRVLILPSGRSTGNRHQESSLRTSRQDCFPLARSCSWSCH